MTATTVDGRKVVATEPAMSNLVPAGAGQAVPFKRIARLLLEDGAEVFGCNDPSCEETADSPHKLLYHVRSHGGVLRPRAHHDNSNGLADMSVADLLGAMQRFEALSQALERMTEDRNRWKAEATSLKRDLATIRRALGVS